MAPDPLPGERATLVDWLAVAAGTIGALMAMFDISIVNSALPTIQGEIGASGTEGTWISTAYLVAEIIAIPLSGWLENLLGLRSLLLGAVILFMSFSALCGISNSLPMMIVGRAGQGLVGGVLIPTAMTIVMTRLPRSQQPLGNTLFGSTIVMGPVIGPVLGGWLTENASWHYAFFINLPIGFALILLVGVAMQHHRPKPEFLREADWLGIAGLVFGFGGLTTLLEEGERELWFSSPLIRILAILSILGFVLLGIGQRTARRPVIRLSLLLDRQFGAVIAMTVLVGMASYGTAYIIPQFLATIASYNALQAGEVVLLNAVPAILAMPITPYLWRRIDVRVAVFCGMGLLSFSAYLETFLSSDSGGSAFVGSQLLRGVGTLLTVSFMNQAAIRSVEREVASDAAGLYNTARNFGGSLALAGIAAIQNSRVWLHSRRIEDGLNVNSPDVQAYMAHQAQALGGMDAAYRSLEGAIRIQALTMTYIDLFWILSVAALCAMPLAFFLRPIRSIGGRTVGAH